MTDQIKRLEGAIDNFTNLGNCTSEDVEIILEAAYSHLATLKAKPNLADMIDKITPENKHTLLDCYGVDGDMGKTQRAMHPSEFSQEDLDTIAKSKVPDEYAYLDEELNEAELNEKLHTGDFT